MIKPGCLMYRVLLLPRLGTSISVALSFAQNEGFERRGGVPIGLGIGINGQPIMCNYGEKQDAATV